MKTPERRMSSTAVVRVLLFLTIFSFFGSPIDALTPVGGCNQEANEEVASSQQQQVEVYRIVGITKGGTQSFPASYVKTFPRWKIDAQENRLVPISKEDKDDSSPADAPSCDAANSSADKISVMPTLNFLIKGGMPAYVMAGMSVGSTDDYYDGASATNFANINHLAQQWTTFSMISEPNFRMEIFLGPNDGTDERLGMVSAKAVKAGVEQLGQALANTEDDRLSTDFHIVTIPMKLVMDSARSDSNAAARRMQEKMKQQQQQQSNEKTDYTDSTKMPLILTCMATAEPDARGLLTLENPLVELTATSKLSMAAQKILG